MTRAATTGVPADAPRPLPGETPWISGLHAPVQIGVYRRLSSNGATTYSFWSGDGWLWNQPSPALASQVSDTELSLVQALPWAGLMTPPLQGYGPTRAATAAVVAPAALC